MKAFAMLRKCEQCWIAVFKFGVKLGLGFTGGECRVSAFRNLNVGTTKLSSHFHSSSADKQMCRLVALKVKGFFSGRQI